MRMLLTGRAEGKSTSTNQTHYPELGSIASSVWNFCARFSADVISQLNQWWRREMSAVFFGYILLVNQQFYNFLVTHKKQKSV